MHDADNGRKDLVQFLQNIKSISEETLNSYASEWEFLSKDRMDFVTREGETQRFQYFVLEGVQFSYYLKNGKQYIVAFTYSPSFSGIPESFFLQKPSGLNLQALTDSSFLRISHEAHLRYLSESKDLNALFRVGAEHLLAGLMQRYVELMSCTIEERFQLFMDRSGHLLQLIPHKYIASYLRIDPTNFSKLLSKKL